MNEVTSSTVSRVQIRFNQEHKGENDAWRLIVDGVEQIVSSVDIQSRVSTELFYKEGVLKGNIFTDGLVFIHEENGNKIATIVAVPSA